MNSYLLGMTTDSRIFTVIFIINILIAFTIIFLERKNPTATLAWILILFFIPVLGFFFYIIFSQNIAREKIYKVSEGELKVIRETLNYQISEVGSDEFVFNNQACENWKNMIKLNQAYGNSYFTQNNSIEIFIDGKKMYHNLLKDIKGAKHSINVMYYIIKDDMVGKKFLKLITEKAKEGVEVRLLVDSLGSRYLNDKKLKEFINYGGKVAYFFKPKLRLINLKFNYRNHRKIVVIDGEKGYIGGFNIANEYLGYKKRFGYWRDTHIKINGDAVGDLNAQFIMDWRFASKEELDLSEAYYVNNKNNGTTAVQIVSSGPNSTKEEIKRGFMKMITSAEKNVYLQTPYLIPDSSMLESLKMAAQSGVDVRVMIPCMPDHIFVYWATLAYCGELLRSGVRIYIYKNGFLHAKTMTVDSEVATVGSANFDRRSFSLNFETNAFLYDEQVACDMENIFLSDINNSIELTMELFEKRSGYIKFKEAISRLLSGIL